MRKRNCSVTDFGDKLPISWEYWRPCCVLMSISGTTGNFHFCRKDYVLHVQHRTCHECHYWFDELLMYAWMAIAFLPNSPPLISERMHCTLSEVITHTPFPLSTVITSISIAVCSVDTQTPSGRHSPTEYLILSADPVKTEMKLTNQVS